VYAFTRCHDDTTLLVIANFSGQAALAVLPDGESWRDSELLVTNVQAPRPLRGEMQLEPWECRVHRRVQVDDGSVYGLTNGGEDQPPNGPAVGCA
jgi:oligo-1,6-glucosidase